MQINQIFKWKTMQNLKKKIFTRAEKSFITMTKPISN